MSSDDEEEEEAEGEIERIQEERKFQQAAMEKEKVSRIKRLCF